MAKEIVSIELDDEVLKVKLNEINKQLNENNKVIAKNKAEISSLTKETKDLDKAFKQGAITAEEYADEIERNATATARLQEENRGLSTENKKLSTDFRNLTAIQEQQVGSLNRLRAELRDAQKQFDALSREQRENAEIGGALQKRIEGLNTEVSKAEQATGRYQRQVGNYAVVGRTFAEALQAQGGALGNLANAAMDGKNAFLAAGAGVKGFSAALATTGIPIVIMAVQGLINVFSQFKPVADAVEDVVNGLAAGFKALIDGGDIGEAVKQSNALLNTIRDLEDTQNAFNISQQKGKNEIDRLIIASKDRTKTEAERLAALQKAEQLEKELFNGQVERNETLAKQQEKTLMQQLKLSKEELKILATTDDANDKAFQKIKARAEQNFAFNEEELKKYQDTLKERAVLEGESAKFTERLVNQRNKLIEKEEEEQEKAAQKQKERLEKLKQERLKYEQDIANLTNEFILSESEKIKAQFAEKLALVKGEGEKEKALRIAIKKAENDALLALEADRLAKEQKLKEEAFQKNTALFNQVLDAEVLKVKQSFLNKEISEKQYNDALDELNIERLESEKVALELAGKSTIEIDNKITEAKIANQKKLEERTQQSSDKIKQIATIERDARIQLAQSVFSFISGLGVKSKALQRSLALASIIASQAQAIGTAVANAQQSALGTGPLAVFTAPGFTATLIGTVLSGIGQAIGTLKQIDSVQTPGFATGGLVKGGIPIKRSNGDNVLATLKTGEVVLNKGQQNALGGAGVFRAIGVPGFATGGVVGNTSAIDNNNSLVSQFTDALQDIQIFTAVTDINTGQSNFAKVVERAQV